MNLDKNYKKLKLLKITNNNVDNEFGEMIFIVQIKTICLNSF